MKYSYILPALVATAYAQDACGVVAGDGTEFTGTVGAIAQGIVAINATTVTLNQTIDSFTGTAQIAPLASAGAAILAEISRQNDIIAPLDPIADDNFDAFGLAAYVSSLACSVNYTVDNLISKKQLLVDACVGPVVLQNIQQQQSESATFIATVRTKIPAFLQDTADGLTQPIIDSLAQGAAAFADQTTVPPSCGGSTTTTTTTGTSTGSATSTSTGSATSTATGGAVYPTSAYGWSAIPYPTEGSNSYPPTTSGSYATASPYPTQGGEEEDCEEEEYPTKTGESYQTGGAVYPTGGASPSYGGDVHTSAPVWEPVYPTGGASPSYPANPSYPAGSPSYPAGNPSYPVSVPVTTGPATKTATSSWAVWTTSSSSAYKPVYTGGAVANAANFGAVAFAVAAAAML